MHNSFKATHEVIDEHSPLSVYKEGSDEFFLLPPEAVEFLRAVDSMIEAKRYKRNRRVADWDWTLRWKRTTTDKVNMNVYTDSGVGGSGGF